MRFGQAWSFGRVRETETALMTDDECAVVMNAFAKEEYNSDAKTHSHTL